MKVLFLDVDGVLNCKSTTERINGVIGPELRLVKIVKRIVDVTNCKIVLSSSWRLYKPDLEHIKRLFVIEDITPNNMGTTDRGCEVIAWLDKHPEVTKHAILDDNTDFHKGQPLFLTSWDTGITDDIADAVIAHLNGQTA